MLALKKCTALGSVPNTILLKKKNDLFGNYSISIISSFQGIRSSRISKLNGPIFKIGNTILK